MKSYINFFYIVKLNSNILTKKIHSMTYRDQTRYFEKLKRYENKFDKKELDDYRMLYKRHRDDEDLDKLSMERLKGYYEKYYVNRPRKNYDHLFKKPEGDNQEE